MNLSNATLADLPASVARPDYDRTTLTPGIVHIGPGAFHRAHQAAYVDSILAQDPRWAISAVALNSTGVADALEPQDGLYTLALLDRETSYRVIGSITELLTAQRRDAILSRIAAPTTRLVTTTVTEKGYHLDAGGALDLDHPAIVRELTGAEPSTLSGWLVAGLAARRAAGGGAITFMSCDNLADNGHRFRRSVRDLAAARDPDLAAWIDDHVRFPSTMVDSITPATDDALRQSVRAATGLDDAWPIQREGFAQWVIEDDFAGVRPPLAAAGADTHVIFKRSGGDLAEEDACIRSLVDAGVEGLVLLPSSSEYIPPAALELVARRFPLVILDRLFDGIPVSAVCSDNLGGGRAATEHLLELGHRTIGFVGSSSHVSSSDDRRNGYIHAHATNHLPLENRAELQTIESTVPGSTDTVEDDIDKLIGFVREHPDITGYVAAEYNIALMLREACSRLGLSIPGDVSVVCFDHPDAFFDTGLFRFTHIRQAQTELGARGIALLQQQIRSALTVDKVVLPTELVLGASTAPPRG